MTRARRRSASGFTLVELMLALVAGLMVAMAVMGVSKEATNTFHEEVRVSGAEMALRVAMERLRMDLQRAAFMSTGNITGDPLIARMANYAGTTPYLSNVTGTLPYSLSHLAGIALRSGGAEVVADAASSAQMSQNGLTPDTIDIGGNFSSSDEYVAFVSWPASPGGATAPCAAGPAISLQMNTPAGWRIRNAESAAGNTGAALQAAFHPGMSTTSQFLLRLTDPTGRYQYLIGAAGGVGVATVYTATSNPPTAIVCLAAGSNVLKTSDTGGLGGVAGFGAGWVIVSPVEVVRWDIQTLAAAALPTTTSTPAATTPYIYGVTTAADPLNFLLTRSFLDFSSCGTGAPCGLDTSTTEIIAEYAVDLKFGVTIDEFPNPACTIFPCPITAPSYTGNYLTNLTMDSTSTLAGNAWVDQTSATWTKNVGPQRIRDVQARIGIRSQFADRTVNLPPPASNSYIYRYQIPASLTPGSGALAFARVRENTSEINLPNQARFYW